MKRSTMAALATASAAALSAAAFLAAPVGAAPPDDGSVQVPAFTLPLSDAISDQARQQAVMAQKSGGAAIMDVGASLAKVTTQKEFVDYVNNYRALVDRFTVPLSEETARFFKVKYTATRIAGVPVEVLEPEGGVAPENRNRVLIGLHGGAFFAGAVYIGRVEAAHVAGTQKIRVIAVDYRMAPEHRFPAASQDVEAIYRDVLKTYPAKNVGIFGCSAGGMLTAQSITWLMDRKLPLPGAIGIFGAGAGRLGGRGDGFYMASIASGRAPPPRTDDSQSPMFKFGYFAGADMNSPLAVPLRSPDLAKFPPTLLITATRAADLSSAIETQRALTRAGVEADLHVWDGLGHCFNGSYQLPEALEADAVIARFFDQHLGK